MSAFHAWLARILDNGSANVSSRRREWVRAAIAEIAILPDGITALGWASGIAGLILSDLSRQALLPWRREPGNGPPSLFIAMASLLLLAPPLVVMAAAAVETGPGDAPLMLGFGWSLAAFVAAALVLWVNVGALFKTMPLGGLVYVISLRMLPMNLLVLALALGLIAFLAPAFLAFLT